MRGFMIALLSVGGVVFFSFCLFISSNLCMFWVFLELGTLSLVPLFFLNSHTSVLDSLFSYLMVSSVSSSLMVCGFLFENIYFCVPLGFLMKFGIFPFFGWVYNVVLGSNWFVMWGFSTFLKSSFLFFSYFMSSGGTLMLSVLCSLTFMILSVLFWVYSYSWVHFWCHMMISSSAAFVAISMVCSLASLLHLFFVYLLWASLVLSFFYKCGSYVTWKGGVWFLYGVLLISFPLSFSVVYKFLMSLSIFSCSFLVFFCWVIYSVSEQLFLVSFMVNSGLPRASFGSLKLI
uniref:NADH dehydrogenase subunit 2 n=1 Tax=Creptotrematina aguirrepequenoi TaxID=985756 RepID=UPI003002A0DE|nr:NADH dehydrogenase subunit 2 [Creptotrematina aguirrepequenoi]